MKPFFEDPVSAATDMAASSGLFPNLSMSQRSFMVKDLLLKRL
jgi:hypothetical protein